MDKITKEYAARIAGGCNSKIDLKTQHRSVYNYIQTNGWLNELCSHMSRKRKWTKQNIVIASYQHKTRESFRTNCSQAYKIAIQLGILDELYPPKYTKESVKRIAHQYAYPKEWQRGHRSSYELAHRRGWFNEIIADMEVRRRFWTDQDLIDLAKQHTTKISLIKENSNAYNLINRRGIQELCFSHMVPAERFPGDNDCVYMWEALDFTYNGLPVYKVGLTSYRLQDQRITTVAKAAQTRYNILRIVQTNCPAHIVENKLLELGVNPKYDKFDGHTEFRALGAEQLKTALDLIDSHGNYPDRAF